MSQQGNASATAGGLSRIPNLSTIRSSTNSRLPSPPVSPSLSSPCTPHTGANHGGNSNFPWTVGGFSQAQDKLVSTSSARLFPTVPALASPSAASTRGHSVAGGIPRSDSMRASTSNLARIPLSPTAASGGPTCPLGVPEMAPPPLLPTGAVNAAESPSGAATSRNSIQVAVRVRPLCDREKQRGDRVAWEADREGNVGLLDAATGAFVPKHRFDTVFGPESDNSAVAAKIALPLITPALRGINGTIFAYGVTSSGKTHTMMGTDADPGIVPRVVRELFAQIAAVKTGPTPSRAFTVRMSVMEIYNEILNDLLDPTRANLKVREDARSNLVLVEGLLEQVVTNSEQALELIARGDHNRKVSATAFNEDSSRSHTITRIIVESAASATPGGNDSSAPFSDRPPNRRTTACLSLIDLAGSESARAVVSKGQRMEGSFINRSLLTLSTVIHKLAAGAAGHVPFRDSKLTRLLQTSLSGAGARVAVVCNITPAAAQTDETANTLKFAARAKLIQVTARMNEVLDDRSLLRRYQKEVSDLKRQLAEARRLLVSAGITGADGTVPPNSIGSVSACGPGGGLTDAGADFTQLGVAEDAAAAALQAERDARQAVEIECTMMRIKLTRLQAFLEERGVDVDKLLLLSTSTSMDLARAGTGGSLRAGDLTTSLPGMPVSSAADAVNSPLFRRPLALTDPPLGPRPLRHASSASRLDVGLYSSRQNGIGNHPEALGNKQHGSYSSCSLAEADLADATAEAGHWSPWGSEPSGHPKGRQMPVSGQSSPSGIGKLTIASNEASAELRAQVAAALEVGGNGSYCRRVSVSGNLSGSDVDVDDDLNEGIMAQIRDMISEARLSCPVPQPATLQPVRTNGEEGSGAVDVTGCIHSVPPPTSGRLPPSGEVAGYAGPGRASSGLGSGGGGPASVSSHHRRSATLSTASSSLGAAQELDMELELQVLNADREVLHDQLVASEAANERLTGQVADLRRQLATYEQLTRHASSELAEIRRLKDVFQARIQRENDALRAQLGMTPVTPMDPQSQSRIPKVSTVQPLEPNRQTGSDTIRPLTQSLPQLQPTSQTQTSGAQNMEAFGSPAAIVPAILSRPSRLSIEGASGGGILRPSPTSRGAPTRADPGSAAPARPQAQENSVSPSGNSSL